MRFEKEDGKRCSCTDRELCVTGAPNWPVLIKQGPGGPVKRMLGPGAAPEPFPEAKSMAQPKSDEELASAIEELKLVPEGIAEAARGADVMKRILSNLGAIVMA